MPLTAIFAFIASLFISLLTFTYTWVASLSLNNFVPVIPTLTPTLLPTLLPSSPVPTSPRPTQTPVPIARLSPVKVLVSPTPSLSDQPWGVAQQVGEHTWTMKIGEDPIMATAAEILTALNEYRRTHGVSVLTWDNRLAAYAQSRADFFAFQNALDAHQGFNDYLQNQDGFAKLGFTALGENASIGYRLNGVHLIEWIYAGDQPHDHNQLDSRWAYIGIGVRGTASCLIFATGKI